MSKSFHTDDQDPLPALLKMPMPLAQVVQRIDEETQPFRRIHRLVDAIEVLVKLHSVIVVSDIFARMQVNDKMRGLLAAGLKTPSLGIWWMFAREFAALYGADQTPFITGLDQYLSKTGKFLFPAMEGEKNLIAFRNHLYHGATPSDDECVKQYAEYEPRFRHLLLNAGHLSAADWVCVDQHGCSYRFAGPATRSIPADGLPAMLPGHAYMVYAGRHLDLHPLLVFMPEESRFFFYNDLRDKYAAYLNYELALRRHDPELRAAILTAYPIATWQKTVSTDFQTDIDRLTESFKGRTADLRKLLQFVEHGRGFLMLWGGPGIGKSALLARFVQLLRLPSREHWSDLVPDESHDDAGQAGNVRVFEYFIRRNHGVRANAGAMLDDLNRRMEQIYRTGIPAGSNTSDKIRALNNRLTSISNKLGEHDRVVLLIDGLDEGLDDPELLGVLPQTVPDRVLVIYSARKLDRLRQRLYLEGLDRERRQELTLGGLEYGDIRAMLSDYVSKYDLQENYVRTVTERCAGHPLYVKLLCESLFKDNSALNESDKLPKSMPDFYEEILGRISSTEKALNLLILLAEAEDFVDVEIISDLLGCDPNDPGEIVGKILPACEEVLTEAPVANKTGLQLFHDSLRDYLRERFKSDCERRQEALYGWCLKWEDFPPASARRRYALNHLPAHARRVLRQLPEAQRLKELVRLEQEVSREAYRAASFEVLGHSRAVQEHYRLLLDNLGCFPEERRQAILLRSLYGYHTEPEQRYHDALAKIDHCGNDLESLTKLAECGRVPRDRVLLVLRGIANMTLPPTGVPPSLREALAGWLAEAREPALNILVEKYLKEFRRCLNP